VVLHAGSLGDWTGIEDLVRGVPTWPEPWVLVVHTRYDAETSLYVENLRAQADPRRVFFSLKPVDRQAYDELVDAADVGLAFYLATGESSFTQRNIQTIGLSSGKLAYYLRAGLPVIVNRASSIAEALQLAGCGIAVERAEDVGIALERVSAQYPAFSSAASAFFEQHLDFARAFGRVIERIEGVRV
jgi:glycosyltransferase involved in cell wall biosynthesis